MSTYTLRPDGPPAEVPSKMTEIYDNATALSLASLYTSVLWSSILLHGVSVTATKASRLAIKVSRSARPW